MSNEELASINKMVLGGDTERQGSASSAVTEKKASISEKLEKDKADIEMFFKEKA